MSLWNHPFFTHDPFFDDFFFVRRENSNKSPAAASQSQSLVHSGDRAIVPAMKIDVSETPSAYKISADLPGIPKENVNISLDASTNLLTISGERKDEMKKEEGETIIRERSYGKVVRTIKLPVDSDASTIGNASFEHGVLNLSIPRKSKEALANENTKQIKIA